MISEKTHQIAITNIPGLGPVGIKKLMEHFDSVSDIFEIGYQKLLELGVQEKIVIEIVKKEYIDRAEKEYQYCLKNGIDILFYTDERYPQRLNFHENLPLLLYYRGGADLNQAKIVSIVGTRSPSKQGFIQCQQIVQALAAYNCLIVSGLAYGIDSKAHQSALDYGLETIGVMASGQDRIYPEDHAEMGQKMLAQGGLLTEYPHQTETIREFFPMRNRIVAAMCDVLIVVESARKGGSLITAEFANQYGKDVFAFPGRPKDEKAEGCNLLIKQHKAHLLESIKDIEYIMRWNAKKAAVQGKLFVELNEIEKKIIQCIRHENECHIDLLSANLGMSSGLLAAEILNLELKGMIKSLPGKRYICIN